ncbi:MAG: aconitate hydratase, partial [Dehalococcoidia bacterium]
MVSGSDPFGARSTLDTPSGPVSYYRLGRLEELGIADLERLPFTIRLLLENALRQSDGGVANRADVERVASWTGARRPPGEFPYMPGRVLLQDFTGVPAV